VQLNSTFHFDSSLGLLTLLTIIDSPLLHITMVSKHNLSLNAFVKSPLVT